MVTMPEGAPPAFHVMTKPSGAICNLDCKYCFYLPKERLYPGSRFRMTDDVLEAYIKQLVETQQAPEATVAWQGGEPTLMELDFFTRSVEYAEKYKKQGQRIAYTMQTNGTILDDEWCSFFKEHGFLIGLSVDGPKELHDAYRVSKGGHGTFDQVMRGWRLLRKHGVDFNILCTVHAANADQPLEVYHFFRDDLEAAFIQFIPIVERINPDGSTLVQEGNTVTDRSVKAEQYGRFLIEVFEEWVRRDVGRVYVQMFDVALANWVGAPPGVCVFSETCGQALALEHNGDLYSCDHFVEPKYFLGNITQTHMTELVSSDKQLRFGRDKLDTLPRYCRECEVRFACHGGCPKNRFIETPEGERGLNYLCAGYKLFFNHVDRSMRMMADLLRRNRAPAEIMRWYAEQDAMRAQAYASAGRNDPCPCGSGLKFKRCHGRSDAAAHG
jgi:uncharacterized protein